MRNTARPRRVAVIGGGISGLAAAYSLARARQAGAPVEEMLIEADCRLGGVIHTEVMEGFVVEGGPDSFLAEKPQAAELARELGLHGDLMGSNDHARRTYILYHGRLVPLPDGLMFLVPTRLWPLVCTPLLSLRTKLAAVGEWFTVPPESDRGDESVASFVERHFGLAMVENIADPLLAGVYGGESAALSVRSVLPRFWEMERQHGSLTRATLRALRRRNAGSNSNHSADPDSAVTGAAPPRKLPLFMTLKGGLQQMTERLAIQLEQSRVYMGRRVDGIELSPGGPGGPNDSCSRRFQIMCQDGRSLDADAVILAMPAHVSGNVVKSLDAGLSELLGNIPYSSSMTVSLGYDEEARASLPSGFGYLVPRKERRRMLACTFVHAKFDHRAPPGKAMLRCFLGGTRDPDVLGLADEEVVNLVLGELKEILNFNAQPLFCRVRRWPRSMAQYPVGHRECVRALEQRLAELPGLYISGNAFSGIGISDCIRTGWAAAEKALTFVGCRMSAVPN